MKSEQETWEQTMLFDIELPPYSQESNIPPESFSEADDPPKTYINGARVPDDEYIYNPQTGNIPNVNSILKKIERGLYKTNAHDLLSDIFECGAIAISNRFDLRRYKAREERYLQIIKKYDTAMQKLIAEIFADIFCLLSQQINPFIGFNDYLGELYMRSETSNSKTGQFFTPYCLSKMCAETAIDKSIVEEYMEQDKILTMCEPTCGAGGMILAAADVLYNKYHFNFSRNLVVECSDIDSRCVHMCYLQLGLAGIPAVIFKRNSLTLETWERWETPAYIMQYTRFKDFLKGTANDQDI